MRDTSGGYNTDLFRKWICYMKKKDSDIVDYMVLVEVSSIGVLVPLLKLKFRNIEEASTQIKDFLHIKPEYEFLSQVSKGENEMFPNVKSDVKVWW